MEMYEIVAVTILQDDSREPDTDLASSKYL